MKESLMRDIDSFIEENREGILRDIARLVAVDSVRGESAAGAPFGAGPAQALKIGLEIARELGLESVNCGDMIGYAGLGPEGDYLATICHLDTVPAGNGWTGDPLTVRHREGYIIGRGVMDDKGPAVLSLYALKYLKDRAVPLRWGVRALLGINEETAMEDVLYYLRTNKEPLFCFSPDANFPLCNGEKGIFRARVSSGCVLENLLELCGGVAENAVPDRAEALVRAQSLCSTAAVTANREGDGLWRLTAHGIGGHASAPDGTVNAIGVLTEYILSNNIAGAGEREFLRFMARLHSATDGSSLGVAASDDVFGALTVIGGMAGIEKGHIWQTVDSRYPSSVSGERIAEALRAAVPEGAQVHVSQDWPPFYIPTDSPAVQACLNAYREVTGDSARPYTIGGGTYARHFPYAVSFGPEHPERPAPAWAGPIHGADEAACKDYLIEALRVYILTLLSLEKLEF